MCEESSGQGLRPMLCKQPHCRRPACAGREGRFALTDGLESDEEDEEKEKEEGTLAALDAWAARGDAGVCVACAGEDEEEGGSRACSPSTRARAPSAEFVSVSASEELPGLSSLLSPVSTLRAWAWAWAKSSGSAASLIPASPQRVATSLPRL